MLTQCPNCDTTFRVTSEILRVAQGQVCCGRCETQFDALERLLEEEEDALDNLVTEDAEEASEAGDAADLRLSEPDLEEDSDLQEDIEAESVAAEEWLDLNEVDVQGAVAEAEVAADPRYSPAEERRAAQGRTNFEIQTETEADEDEVFAEPSEQFEESEESEKEDFLAGTSDRVAPSDYAAAARRRERASTRTPAIGGKRTARPSDAADQFDLIERPLRVPSPAIWKYLAVPLVLLFVFQVFNHYRAPLARHPRFGNAVSSFYRTFGVDFIPDWKLRAYEIKKFGAASDPSRPGTLRVRASVRNRAPFPQPYPLVKVVLEDRYGGAVRAREFEPIEYLDKAPPPNARLAPRQQVLATITIVDPGRDAAGYQLDICLLGNNGPVCTEDLPTLSP